MLKKRNLATLFTLLAACLVLAVGTAFAQSPENFALDATVTASSSAENWGWYISLVNDGKPETDHDNLLMGWTSDDDLDEDHTEWIQLDLGSVKTIDRVVLVPRNDEGNVGYGFPVDFTIEVSTDGSNWTAVVTESGYPMPEDGSPQTFDFADTSARYVKVTGTSLRANPSDNFSYRMQFAEIEVYNAAGM